MGNKKALFEKPMEIAATAYFGVTVPPISVFNCTSDFSLKTL